MIGDRFGESVRRLFARGADSLPSPLGRVARDLERNLGLHDPAQVSRPVSGAELLALAYNQPREPFAIALVVEGDLEGEGLAPVRLERALAEVVRAQASLSMRLAGALQWLRWVSDGPPARLRSVDGAGWNGRDSVGAAFLDDPLDPFVGPSAEVLVAAGASGQPTRLVFRALHALMDGAATQLFAHQFFQALRGEPLAPVHAGPPNDAELGRRFLGADKPPRWRQARPQGCPSLLGPAEVGLEGNRFVRVTVPRSSIAAVSLALIRAAEAVDPDAVELMIPVDMRRPAKLGPTSANLSGMVRLCAGEALRKDDPVAALDQALMAALLRRDFGIGPVGAERALRPLTLPVLRAIVQRLARRDNARFLYSAIVSHLGPMQVDAFGAPGFRARAVFSVPPCVPPPGPPLFAALAETDRGLELTLRAPLAFASGGRLERLVARTTEELLRLNQTIRSTGSEQPDR